MGSHSSLDAYLVPLRSPDQNQNPKPSRRPRWKRVLGELNGKFDPKYRHEISGIFMQSFSEIGAFPHSYHINGAPCQSHVNWVGSGGFVGNPFPFRKKGVSALEFDSKGIYLASATKGGCLTVHDFETLYCQANNFLPCLKEDERKHLLHIPTRHQIDVVRWNLSNQDEVACASMSGSEVHIFDIGYISHKPVKVLRKRASVTVHGSDVHKGVSDIAFTSNDDSRVFASDTHGAIHVWDRRVSDLPCLGLTTNSSSNLNRIQVNVENQVIFGACKNGMIHIWDLRGGRPSTAFQSHKDVKISPITSVKVASMLDKNRSLKAQSNIVPKEIHSIDVNPSCPYQLAFHLDDGWSGVLDIHNFQVTHIHCPPPPWLDGMSASIDLSYMRKPSWLPSYSIYAVGSASNDGIHLLDFYPDPSSPCHVDNVECMDSLPKDNIQRKQNWFVPLSEGVTACASHPLNGTIVAGTKQSSLLMISQKQQPFKGAHCSDNEDRINS